MRGGFVERRIERRGVGPQIVITVWMLAEGDELLSGAQNLDGLALAETGKVKSDLARRALAGSIDKERAARQPAAADRRVAEVVASDRERGLRRHGLVNIEVDDA